MPVAEYYMPPTLVEPLTEIMRLWEKIEEHEYKFKFIGVGTEDIEINPQHIIRAFPTYHRIESFGYTLFHRSRKLLPELDGAPREVIIQAKKQGLAIDKEHLIPLVSFTGDTKIEFLQGPDWIRKSKILILERTYLDHKKSVQEDRDPANALPGHAAARPAWARVRACASPSVHRSSCPAVPSTCRRSRH